MDTILFDLDGTLLPLSQEAFVNAYFRELVCKLSPLGYEKNAVIGALWSGTRAMLENDGKLSNRDRFWPAFAGALGEGAYALEDILNGFYTTEFNRVRSLIGDCSWVRPLIARLRGQGFSLVLATNPIFPMVAVLSRLGWLGLSADDFIFITSYENSSYCKPNLKYYFELLEKINKAPGDCLMVGNNPAEDMCAADTGMSVFLATDYLEAPPDADLSGFRRGGALELCEFLQSLKISEDF